MKLTDREVMEQLEEEGVYIQKFEKYFQRTEALFNYPGSPLYKAYSRVDQRNLMLLVAKASNANVSGKRRGFSLVEAPKGLFEPNGNGANTDYDGIEPNRNRPGPRLEDFKYIHARFLKVLHEVAPDICTLKEYPKKFLELEPELGSHLDQNSKFASSFYKLLAPKCTSGELEEILNYRKMLMGIEGILNHIFHLVTEADKERAYKQANVIEAAQYLHGSMDRLFMLAGDNRLAATRGIDSDICEASIYAETMKTIDLNLAISEINSLYLARKKTALLIGEEFNHRAFFYTSNDSDKVGSRIDIAERILTAFDSKLPKRLTLTQWHDYALRLDKAYRALYSVVDLEGGSTWHESQRYWLYVYATVFNCFKKCPRFVGTGMGDSNRKLKLEEQLELGNDEPLFDMDHAAVRLLTQHLSILCQSDSSNQFIIDGVKGALETSRNMATWRLWNLTILKSLPLNRGVNYIKGLVELYRNE